MRALARRAVFLLALLPLLAAARAAGGDADEVAPRRLSSVWSSIARFFIHEKPKEDPLGFAADQPRAVQVRRPRQKEKHTKAKSLLLQRKGKAASKARMNRPQHTQRTPKLCTFAQWSVSC